MRIAVASALALSAALNASSGCRPQETAPPPQEEERYREAYALHAAGKMDEALAAYRSLASAASDREIRALATQGAVRIEIAQEQRAKALELLVELPGRVEQLGATGAEDVIDDLLVRTAESPFRDEIAAAAAAARADIQRRAANRRETELAAARELIRRGEFAAALEFLRTVEGKRDARDRADVMIVLAELREASDRAAGELKKEIEPLLAPAPAKAAHRLDEQLANFRGTRAYAELLGIRKRIEPPPAGNE